VWQPAPRLSGHGRKWNSTYARQGRTAKRLYALVFFVSTKIDVPRCRGPPASEIGLYQISETEVCRMARQYFIKKDPSAQGSTVEWIKLDKQAFVEFLAACENRGRRFARIGNITIEASEPDY